MDECGCVFQCLYQVGLQRIFQQYSHSAVCANLFCGYRFIIISIANDDFAQHFFQVMQVVCQTENCHNFRSNGDLEAVFSGNTVYLAAQTGNHMTELSVVQVYNSFPSDFSGVDVQFIALLDMVVHHGSQQVICCCDGMEVTCKVQVDVFHRHYLCIAAASRTAFDTHAGTQRGFSQACQGVFAHFLQGLCQTDGNGCFAFPSRCRVYSCYQNQFCVGSVFDLIIIFITYFGFILAITFHIFFGDASFRRNGGNGFHGAFLCNLQICFHLQKLLSPIPICPCACLSYFEKKPTVQA